MRLIQPALIAAIILATSCLPYGATAGPAIPTEIVPRSGVSIDTPSAITTPSGVRFHGSVCSGAQAGQPSVIHVDRVNAQGDLLASASRRLSGLGGRGGHCAFYDVPTDWMIAPGDRVRVCALRSDGLCQAKAEKP